MNIWLAILVTIVLLVVSSFLNIGWLLVIITSVWMAVDSNQIKIREYKTGLAVHPALIFLFSLMIWIVCFPWYLSVRHKIKNGEMPKNDGQRQRMVRPWAWIALAVTLSLPIIIVIVAIAYGQISHMKL